MSQQPAEVVNGLYEAFGRGDVPAILDALAEDIDWRVPDNVPQGGEFHGREAVGRFFQGLGEHWEDLSIDQEAVVSDGERVVVLLRAEGRLRSSGEQSGYSAVHAWTVRDGTPVRFYEYVDAPLAMPAAAAASA
jgi:ketosteroid isomerase-like protein